MDTIHRGLAFAAVGIVIVGIAWSLALVRLSNDRARGFERFQAAVVSLMIVASVSGLLLLLAGGKPADPLHLLYAVIAIAVIPLARSFLGRASHRRAALLMLAAFAAIGAVLYRLFTTG